MMFTLLSFALLAEVAISEPACQDGSLQCVSKDVDETTLVQSRSALKPRASDGHVSAIGDLPFQEFINQHLKFDNQSAMDAFMKKHESKPFPAASLLGVTSGATADELADQHLEVNGSHRSLLSLQSVCPLKYSGQFFKPRLNLCSSSFTGLDSCTEYACALLTNYYYGDSCYSVYYTNAETQDSLMGMCRCLPKDANSYSRYYSSTGNNIYSCASWF